jgi:large subunit ribosomal protein L3
VAKGKKMPGRMGNQRTAVFGQSIAYVNKEKNLLGISGAVPGRKDSLVEIVVNEE